MEEGAPPSVRCPECGDAADGATATARMRCRRSVARRVGWVFALLGVVAAGLWIWATTKSSGVANSGSYGQLLVDPGYTRADLERLASGEAVGEGDAQELVAAVLERTHRPEQWQLAGITGVEVAFSRAESARQTIARLGWPVAWRHKHEYHIYADGARRTGFRKAVTDPAARSWEKYEAPRPLAIAPRPRWERIAGGVRFQPPPEETGGVLTIVTYRWASLAAPAAMLILAWYAASIVLWLFRKRGWDPERKRRLRWGAVVGMVLVLAIGTFATATGEELPLYVEAQRTQANYPPAPVYWTREGYTRLSLSREEIAGLLGDPEGNRTLARLILDESAATGDGYLVVAADRETSWERGSWHQSFGSVASLIRYTCIRRPDFGDPVRMAIPAGVRFATRENAWIVFVSAGDPERPAYLLHVNPSMLGLVVIGIWLAGVLGWGAAWLALVLRAARRSGRGQCLGCGYPLPAG